MKTHSDIKKAQKAVNEIKNKKMRLKRQLLTIKLQRDINSFAVAIREWSGSIKQSTLFTTSTGTADNLIALVAEQKPVQRRIRKGCPHRIRKRVL